MVRAKVDHETNTASSSTGMVSRAVTVAIAIWVAISVALTVMPALVLDTFGYGHAWVSAHFATIARTFAEVGIVELGGVPVQNNLPLLAAPDIYINWPPLYGYALSFIINGFGDGERVIHLSAVAVTISIALILYFISRIAFDRTAALVGCAVYLNSPIIAMYGHMGSQLMLSVLLVLVALYLFLIAVRYNDDTQGGIRRGAALAACLLTFLAVTASWEAVLAPAFMVVFAALARDYKAVRLSFVMGICGVIAVAAVFLIYFISYPEYFDALITRLWLRAGFAIDYATDLPDFAAQPHFLQERSEATIERNWLKSAVGRVIHRLELIGPLGLFAFLFVVYRRAMKPNQSIPLEPVFAAVGGMFLLWMLLMPHHMSIHDYQFLLIAPIVAPAAAYFVQSCNLSSKLDASVAVVLVVTLTFTSLYFRIEETRSLLKSDRYAQEISLMRQIAETLPEEAIVLNPNRSMVPVYYSQRHMIRFVKSDTDVAEVYPEALRELCETCPIFLVVPNDLVENFTISLVRYPEQARGDFGRVLYLGP